MSHASGYCVVGLVLGRDGGSVKSFKGSFSRTFSRMPSKVFSKIFSTMLLGVFLDGISCGVPWLRLVPVVWGRCEGVGVGVSGAILDLGSTRT